jgi:hypothetical protein
MVGRLATEEDLEQLRVDSRSQPWAADETSRLILVLSSERSGSTLTRVMLGEHSRIVAPAELFFMRYPDYDTWRRLKPEATASVTEYFDLIGKPRSITEIDAACRGADTARVYEWLYGFLPPRSFLLDKTPAYANTMEPLERSVPFAPFYIWLIRHPLGVIDSHVRLKEKEAAGARRLKREINRRFEGWLDGGMSKLARRREQKWVTQNSNIHRFLATIPDRQKHVVRFEQLVLDPTATLQQLCTAIGIEFEEKLARPHTKRRSMKPGIGDPNFDTHSRVDSEPATGWQQRFSERSLAPATLELIRTIGAGRR